MDRRRRFPRMFGSRARFVADARGVHRLYPGGQTRRKRRFRRTLFLRPRLLRGQHRDEYVQIARVLRFGGTAKNSRGYHRAEQSRRRVSRVSSRAGRIEVLYFQVYQPGRRLR